MAWQDQLQAASFRGVPFYVDEAAGNAGRRIAPHEYPFRDTASPEDLGAAAVRHMIRAYVIGPDYMAQRDALLAAVNSNSTAAVLVHPTLGQIRCKAGLLRWRETRTEGGWCVFDIEFIEDGPRGPAAGADTASSLLSGIASLLPVIEGAYAIGTLIAQNPGILLGFAQNLLGGAATAFLGLPAGTLSGIAALANGWGSNVTNDAATATMVSQAITAAGQNVVTAATPPATASDPVTGAPPIVPTSSDPSGGLVGLAGWGAALPPIVPLAAYYSAGAYTGPIDPAAAPAGATPLAVQQAVIQQTIGELVAGSATAAVATIYAQATWPTANAAQAARTQILGLISARIDAAANAGTDGAYMAWSALATLVFRDMVERAQGLPVQATYDLPAPLPALALAQRLYQDPTQADALVALNDWPHPAFMPQSGLYLSAAQ